MPELLSVATGVPPNVVDASAVRGRVKRSSETSRRGGGSLEVVDGTRVRRRYTVARLGFATSQGQLRSATIPISTTRSRWVRR